jgi:sulfur carrier protein
VIVVNGKPAEVQAGETLADVLAGMGLSVRARGVAVAVDGEVLPRADWDTHVLAPGARVEVLTAMQGG